MIPPGEGRKDTRKDRDMFYILGNVGMNSNECKYLFLIYRCRRGLAMARMMTVPWAYG